MPDASQNPYLAPGATPQQHVNPFGPERILSFGAAPDARVPPPAFQSNMGWHQALDATQNPFNGGPTMASAPIGWQHHQQYQQQHWSPGGHATPSAYNPATQYGSMGMQAAHGATQHPMSGVPMGVPMTPVPFGMQVQDPHSQQQQMQQWMTSARAEQRAQQSVADAREHAMQQHLQQLQHQLATLSAGGSSFKL